MLKGHKLRWKGAMLEPRYSPPSPAASARLLDLASAAALAANAEAAAAASNEQQQKQHEEEGLDLSTRSEENNESEEEAPLDLKVRSKPSFPSSLSMPGPQQRAELLRIAEFYTSGIEKQNESRDSSQERDDSCQYCGFDTTSADFDSSEHREGVCNRGSFACAVCAKTFTQFSHFQAHNKTHHKVKQRQYPCATCAKIFTSASNRNMHQRIHKGVRPFQCSPCGVFFRQKAHLQKHQKTQGHVQATEMFEKKRREGLIPEDEEMDDDTNSTRDSTGRRIAINQDEEDTNSSSDHVMMADSTALLADEKIFRTRVKSSPKRKQSKPQYHSQIADDDQSPIVGHSDEQIHSLVEYNDTSHGYECGLCGHSSHELSVVKDHVRDEHLAADRGDLMRCGECRFAFKTEFHLRIHGKRHETVGRVLPCDHCADAFKVPNQLLRHMENEHTICSSCGDRFPDKLALHKHHEISHEDRVRFNTPLPTVKTPTLSMENRAAKMRKVDSLAEVIRQKQLQQTQHVTSNGNEVKVGITPPPRKRKNDLRALLAAAEDNPFLAPSFLNHLQPSGLVHEMMRKSENNNVLSSLKLPPSVRLPTHPVSGLTPPSSPSKESPTIRGELSVTIVPSPREDTDEETGLDLSMRSRVKTQTHSSGSSSDENEVSTTAKDDLMDTTSLYSRLHGFSAPTFPPPVSLAGFPFLSGLLPPVPTGGPDPSIAEQLLKLSAGLPPSQPLAPPHSPSQPSSSLSHPYTVLSAMLGHPPYHQPVFPGMAPNLIIPSSQSSTSLQDIKDSVSLVPPRPRSMSPDSFRASSLNNNTPSTSSNNRSNKPFSCSYCHKDFSHLTSLESHMDHMHSGEAKHMCEACGKNFSSKSNLTAHKKIHSGERPFVCAVCNKCFRQKAHLQKHETTHSSATPFQCTVCDKAFGHPSNLNTHMATHSNVRPYQCTDCGKSYKDSASFKRHRLGHTGERPHPCSLCSEAFIDSKQLRRHRENAHPTAQPDPDLDSVGDEDDEEEEIDDDEDEGILVRSSESDAKDDENKNNNASTSSAYSSFESRDEVEEQEEQEEQAEKSR